MVFNGGMEIDFLAHHPAQLDRVARWYHACWWHRHGDYEASRARLAAQLGTDRLPITLVALKSGVACGAAALWACDHDLRTELTPWFSVLYVPPEYRGQGVATRLINHRIALAGALGYKRAYSWAEPESWPFHQRRGWEVFDPRQRILTRTLEE